MRAGDTVRWWRPDQGFIVGRITEVYPADGDRSFPRAVVTFGPGDARILPLAALVVVPNRETQSAVSALTVGEAVTDNRLVQGADGPEQAV